MILGARMITKSFFYRIWNLVLTGEKYESSSDALFDTLNR
jgi:hypothetical protein